MAKKMEYKDNYAFTGEWYDTHASMMRQFIIFYFPIDDTVEIYDLKYRKMFMNRIKVDGVSLDSFYVGATLHVYSRLFTITGYANVITKNRLDAEMEITFTVLKPMSITLVGKILTLFHKNDLRVTRLKRTKLNSDDAMFLYRRLTGDNRLPFLLEHVDGKEAHLIELVGKGAVKNLLDLLGHVNPFKAKPGTIRAMYGLDSVRNCATAVSSREEALANINYFFPPPAQQSMTKLRLTATLSNCTLCIIKPHAVKDGLTGEILQCIEEGGFDVTAINMLIVDKINAEEFYEVYKGISPEYMAMVEHLASGPCVALEVVSKDHTVNTAVEFRKLVGPVDPEIGRLIRPHTLRSKFGKNKVCNAIHCSDLPHDGLLEVEYFFKILAF